jgi:hypothetical protein
MERLRSGAAIKRRAYESAANSSILTRPAKLLDPFMVEHEFRDRARDICVAHQRERTIVKDQAMLSVDERCLQPDLVDADRIVPIAGVAASRDLDASSSTQRAAT